jgi:hypothetical protein
MRIFAILTVCFMTPLSCFAQLSCDLIFAKSFQNHESLRNFHLKGTNKTYPEILKMNGLEFISETPIDGKAKNGYLIYIRYKGVEISFTTNSRREFTEKSAQAIEGAIRAIEMSAHPKLLPTGATARTKFRDPKILTLLPLPVQRWIFSEQHQLSREVDTKLTKGFSPNRNYQEAAFKPESAKVFELHGYWISAKSFQLIQSVPGQSRIAASLERSYNGQKQILLMVHPESFDFYRPFLTDHSGVETFIATPTASSRSMLVWKEGNEQSPFILKASLDRQIGNIVRLIDNTEIAKSSGMDLILDNAQKEFTNDMQFVRETAGVVPTGMSAGGFIIREFPPEMLNAKSSTSQAPLFALYGTSEKSKQPMLLGLIHTSHQRADVYVSEKIIKPLARQWTQLALEHGLVMEPHAQNAMVEIQYSAAGPILSRFVYRDYGGFSFDFQLRRSLGLFVPENLPTLGKSFNEVYDPQGHAKHYSTSLAKYLDGGFLSQVEVNMLKWQKAGLIDQAFSKGSTRDLLLREVEKEILRITGQQVHLKNDYSNLNDVMNELVASIKGQH